MRYKKKISVAINELYENEARKWAQKDNVSFSEYVSLAVSWYNGKHREEQKKARLEEMKLAGSIQETADKNITLIDGKPYTDEELIQIAKTRWIPEDD